MANILERYGIKEVADVWFYKLDDNGDFEAPVLYLDSLKVSTIEQTGEVAEAKGGKGNPARVAWDYNKEINVTLEDALFSARSMAVMFSKDPLTSAMSTNQSIKHTIQWTPKTDAEATAIPSTVEVYGKDGVLTSTTLLNPVIYDMSGTSIASSSVSKNNSYFITGDIKSDNSLTVKINSDSFPGTYGVIGDTYARSENSGHDEYFQFKINKAKVTSENTITLEAEGDPSVFNLNLRVLKPADGKAMMELIKYDFSLTEPSSGS